MCKPELKEHQHSRKLIERSCWDWYSGDDCEPEFQNTEILAQRIGKLTREIIEAYHMKKNGTIFISQTSISLRKTQAWRQGAKLL